MFWRKRKSRDSDRDGSRAGQQESDLHQVQFGCGMFGLFLPTGTMVDEHSPGVGSFSPPDAAGDFIFSISSYDIELYGLQDTRPAEAALGEGEALGPASESSAPADDYETIHGIAADDGPYAEFGGYLMRLWLHEDRYLRAFRIAVTDSRDLEWAHLFLSTSGAAPASTAIDLDQHDPEAARVVLGGHFRITLPVSWTPHISEDDADAEDDDEEDDGSEKFYGLSADQRLLLEIKVVEQWAEDPLNAEEIKEMLAENTATEMSLINEQGQTGRVLTLEDGFRLVATDGVRNTDGRREQFYTAESLAPSHRVYAHYWLTTLDDGMDDAEWERGVQSAEAAIRGALIYHPRRFTVGEDD